jgi:hypothetical protein
MALGGPLMAWTNGGGDQPIYPKNGRTPPLLLVNVRRAGEAGVRR